MLLLKDFMNRNKELLWFCINATYYKYYKIEWFQAGIISNICKEEVGFPICQVMCSCKFYCDP